MMWGAPMPRIEKRTLVFDYRDVYEEYEGINCEDVELHHLKTPNSSKYPEQQPIRANIIMYQGAKGNVKILKNRYGKRGIVQ